MFKARPFARLGALAPVALGLLLTLPLLGCGEEPKAPPRLTNFTPAIPSVAAGESLTITVAHDPGDYEIDRFEWTAAAGEIDGNGQAEITYTAPAEKGDYKLTVAVTYDEQTVALDTVVKVQAPPSTPATGTGATPAAEDEPATASAATDTDATETTEAKSEPDTEAAAAPTETEPKTAATAEAEAEPEPDTEAAAPPTETESETTATAEAEAEAEPNTEAAAAPTETEPETAAPTGAETESQPNAEVATETEPDASATAEAETESEPDTSAAGVSTETDTEVAETAEVETESQPDTQAASSETEPEAAAAVEAEPGAEVETAEVAALSEPAAETADAPATAPTAAATTPEPSRIDDVLARGTLRAIVQLGFEPFSFLGEDGLRVGFDVDLAREFARRWLGDAQAVELLAVPTDARIPTLVDGRGDVIAAALTDTPARREQVDFSITYFKDGQRLLVAEGSNIADVCELRGRKIAVTAGSTSLDNIEAAAVDCGFTPDLVEFRRHADAIEALLAGDVQAFTSDGVALENIAKGQPLQVVGNHFSDEPYGIAVPKGDRRFRELVDSTLVEMESDGTLAGLYQKWFGDTIAPYPLEAPAAAPVEVAAATTSDAPPVVEPVTSEAAAVTSYVVQPGETLSKIAGKVWGDVGPDAWRRLYEANRDLIGDDPAKIEVGMELQVPS